VEEDTDDEEFFTDLPTDTEAEETVAEQRAILAPFETWRRKETTQQFMAAERRAAAARLADEHATARANAHRRNIEATRAAMVVAEQRLAQADRAEGLATVAAKRQRRENQYPLLRSTRGPSGRRNAAPSPPSSRTPSATVAGVCRRRAVAAAGWFPADQGSSMTAQGRPTLHHHRAHRAPTPPARTPRTTSRLAFS
jgi:hypothetical protein